MKALKENERLDDLQRNGLYIIQRPDAFRFGTDSVLLAHHSGIKNGDRVCDLGCGTGVLSLLLSAARKNAVFDAVEILPDMADMARRSVEYNRLEDRIRVHAMDMRAAPERLGRGGHTLVLCNPPYYSVSSGRIAQNEGRSSARHEVHIALADIARIASALLQHHGRFSLVIPAFRSAEATWALQAAGIEPKYARLVIARPDRIPKLLLIRGIKGANPGIHWAAPLITHEENGEYSKEMQEIYGEGIRGT